MRLYFADNFTVMSYNILFDKYCTRQLYGYCPSWGLHWDYRKNEILKEIIQYNADILTLQVSIIYVLSSLARIFLCSYDYCTLYCSTMQLVYAIKDCISSHVNIIWLGIIYEQQKQLYFSWSALFYCCKVWICVMNTDRALYSTRLI